MSSHGDERKEVSSEASTEVESQQQRRGRESQESRSNHRGRVTLRRGDALRLRCASYVVQHSFWSLASYFTCISTPVILPGSIFGFF